jgi:hypothetical protein
MSLAIMIAEGSFVAIRSNCGLVLGTGGVDFDFDTVTSPIVEYILKY